MALFDSFPADVEVKLDGTPVEIPADRRSFSAIRSYLESLALQQQRILCCLSVDGQPVHLTQPRKAMGSFAHVEAETMSLNEVPAQLIKAALQQADAVRARLQSAVELVLINDRTRARELWWNLSTALKEPLLTLSLVPASACGTAGGCASPLQLRKWQLEQLGAVIREVDEACASPDTTVLSDALEQRALPWLDGLRESMRLWNELLSLAPQSAACQGA